MSEKGGRYKIITRRSTVTSSGTDTPIGKIKRNASSLLTDKVAVEKPLPEKARKLAEAFAGINEVFETTFLERIDREKNYAGIYEQYNRILYAIRKTAESLEPGIKVSYLYRAAGLFRHMKNELSSAPYAYEILGKCMAEGTEKADEFLRKVIAAKDNETLPKICREFNR